MSPDAQGKVAPVAPGDILAGKYRVDRVLGAGGMGVVVAAHHMQLDDKVAIKFLLPEALQNPEAVARFDREARAAVKIRSEHVARVIDVGKLDNGSPYMVMEYLDGGDLEHLLQRRGRLPIDEAVDFVLQACEAIAEAHAMGIVHRDLKPANLFCIRRPDGALSVKVLDFGISKLTGPGGSMGMTSTQTVIGSPLYMSPEQMESSKGVDPRSDIWAIGVILYELVTGQVPFQGEAITELVLRIVTMPPPPIREVLRPDVPPGLERVIKRCLEKDRNSRFSNVAELALALIEFAPPRSRLSVERITGVLQAAGITVAPVLAPGTPPVDPSKQPALMGTTPASWGGPDGKVAAARAQSGGKSAGIVFAILGGLVVLGGLAIAAVFVLQKHHEPESSPTTAASPAAPPATATATTPVTTAAAPTAPAAPPAAPVESAAPVAVAPSAPAPAPTVAAPGAPTATDAPAVPTATHRPSAPLPPAAPTAPATSKPAAKPNCDPPYFVDASGHRQYKKECF
jgi:serine/threonine-protein kinase